MGPVGWVVHSDQTGRFATGQMVPGPYVFAITKVPAGWMVKSVTVAGRNVMDRTFDLTPSAIGDAVITLADKVSSLAGTVRDSNGMPEPQATIVVFPTDKSLWLPTALTSSRIRSTAPGRDGRYSFRGLPAGEYFLTAFDTPPAGAPGTTLLNALTNGATRITIGEGETKAQDLKVTVVR